MKPIPPQFEIPSPSDCANGRLLASSVAAVLSLMVIAAALVGCAVGPNFKPPAPPRAAGYVSAPLPQATASAPGSAGTAQTFSATRDIPAQWWTLFRSPQLDALIEKAFRNNPTIEAAQAALRQAQENVYAQRGFFFPTIQASYSPSRIMISGNMAGGNAPGVQGNGTSLVAFQGVPASQGGTPPFTKPVIYNWHSAQVTVGFVPDIFGVNRRRVESLRAQEDARRFQLEATYITLASNVVAAAIQEASLRAQIAAVKKIIAANRKSLAILQRQFKLGYTDRLGVAGQEAALAQSQQLLPPLQRQLAQTRDLIRMLVGNTPDHDVAETFTLASLNLPAALPLSLPSRLVEQRPDVRVAESLLHAATARVGVAVGDLLPQFSIYANAGGQATVLKEMFWPSGKFFGIIGNLSQTLFAGGTLLHEKRAAEDALKQTAAQYRSTVLAALRNVADTLHAIYSDADALKLAVRAEQSARESLSMTRTQQEHGYVGYLALLSAEQSYQAASIALVQARASRFGDTVALFQALGGGWWNRTADGVEGKKTVSLDKTP